MKKAIIFGCGALGKLALPIAVEEGYNVVAFSDNNQTLWETYLNAHEGGYLLLILIKSPN